MKILNIEHVHQLIISTFLLQFTKKFGFLFETQCMESKYSHKLIYLNLIIVFFCSDDLSLICADVINFTFMIPRQKFVFSITVFVFVLKNTQFYLNSRCTQFKSLDLKLQKNYYSPIKHLWNLEKLEKKYC